VLVGERDHGEEGLPAPVVPEDEQVTTRIRAEGWPLRTYFALLVALFVLVAGAGVVYVQARADADGRNAAEADARATALTAAAQLGQGVAQLRTTAAGLAATPQQIAPVVANPSTCSLAMSLGGGLTTGHLDLVRPDGSVACSSLGPAITRHAGVYAGASWFAPAKLRPAMLAPIRDDATGRWTVLADAPVGSIAIATAFADLAPVGQELKRDYGGGHPVEVIVTSGSTVIARSLSPGRWIGRSIAGTRFARAGNAVQRVDLDGRSRLYEQAKVPGTDWVLAVGSDDGAAVSTGTRLARGQLAIIVIGLLGIFAAALVVYLKIDRPMARLTGAVSGDAGLSRQIEVPDRGPAETRALAASINLLIGRVADEFAGRGRAEEAARSADRSYRTLFDGSPVPMWVYDVKTRSILEVNAAALEHYGYTRDEFVALKMDAIVADEPRAPVAPMDPEQGAWDSVPRTLHRKRDGAEIEVGVVERDVEFDGRAARFVIAEDVGEREALARQLRQSQRLESLGQLAGGIAHDFNNLLGVILSYGGLIHEQVAAAAAQDGELWSEAESDLREIVLAAERAARLTRQLLVFSRREIAQAHVIDINAVVDGLEELLRRTLGEHIELMTTLGHEIAPVTIDPGQLEQVLVNLAVNARDAMPSGGTLAIDTSTVIVDHAFTAANPGIAEGHYVRITVSDTGAGMDEIVVERAFDPFFTTKPSGEGTGLGLATVHGIVMQAGGRVRIYSEPGHGTTVSVMLPEAREEAGEPDPAPAATAPSGGTETILLVEDEAALREATTRILTKAGYRVIVAADGAEAVQLAGQVSEPIDMLLTDVVMPVMLGHEVAERVASIRPGISLLYISGYARSVLGTQGRLDPGVSLIEKPFSEPGLLRKVREVLDAGPLDARPPEVPVTR
jgi:PAS domain S-box-containing protein